jgi:hypothetical protein
MLKVVCNKKEGHEGRLCIVLGPRIVCLLILYIFWRDKVCWPLLCLCRLFVF